MKATVWKGSKAESDALDDYIKNELPAEKKKFCQEKDAQEAVKMFPNTTATIAVAQYLKLRAAKVWLKENMK